MTQVGCGPTWTIDGPPPQAPFYTLLDAARIVDDVEERWVNGVKVYPFPIELANVWDAMATGSPQAEKSFGGAVPLPLFQAMVVYLGEKCTAAGIAGGGISQDDAQRRFVARATTAFGAVEAAAVEAEFASGTILGGVNPHLADGNADIVIAGAKNPRVAFASLENAIGETGRAGIIHTTPAVVSAAAGYGVLFWRDERGPSGRPVLRTVNGTIVVPGYGYVDALDPTGATASGATQDYAYATGMVEVRRSETFLIPEDVSAALNRRDNTIEYLVERYYVADWDTALQAAVLVDWST